MDSTIRTQSLASLGQIIQETSYNEGLAIGYDKGVTACIDYLMNQAVDFFKSGRNDDRALDLRAIAKDLSGVYTSPVDHDLIDRRERAFAELDIRQQEIKQITAQASSAVNKRV
ncbi:hypothetical protein GCM10023189_42930 [Nibrella saemangeumensis]|uniref:Uncharacterized protein n=1 Tax=Nibrella saemangeumensis TaxID=1084526 RepID=A0ABP8NDQ9_9BACT